MWTRRTWCFLHGSSLLIAGAFPAIFKLVGPIVYLAARRDSWQLIDGLRQDILALDEVQTVLYTHLVITRFLYRSAGLNEHQSLSKKPRSQQFSGFSSEMWPTSGYDMPRNVDPSVKKGVGLKQLANCMLRNVTRN